MMTMRDQVALSPLRRAMLGGFVGLLLLAALVAPAHSKPLVGVGDNGPPMFLDANFRSLNTKIARKIIPYDFYTSPFEIDQMNQWVANASALGIEPLISFQRSETHPKKLPSVAEFKKSVKYLLANYPAVRTISPWNEANHVTQPTFKKPKRAAEYFNATRSLCARCKIVAADVLDQSNMLPWLKVFKKHAKKPKIWGLHSYADSNKSIPWRRSATKKLLSSVRGKVWLTEVGGLVAFKFNFPYDEQRAARAVTKTIAIAEKSPRIQRVYLYSWFGTVQPFVVPPYKWDSGLVSAAGAPRPGFFALKSWMDASR